MSLDFAHGITAEIHTADSIITGIATPHVDGWFVLVNGETIHLHSDEIVEMYPLLDTIRCVSCGTDQPYVSDDVHRFCAVCDTVEVCTTCGDAVSISGCACDAADSRFDTERDR